MKKILLACISAWLWLMPAMAATAEGAATLKYPDINKEGWILYVTSEPEDGKIDMVRIYDSENELVLTETDCGGYVCYVDLIHLNSGNYTAKVFTQYAPVYTEGFSIE
ncbi:MAG: hypothetical protein KIS94_09320 [Chitinophagales bacterium]|nr:hypothetical protein [Chitinophagales bacterium]